MSIRIKVTTIMQDLKDGQATGEPLQPQAMRHWDTRGKSLGPEPIRTIPNQSKERMYRQTLLQFVPKCAACSNPTEISKKSPSGYTIACKECQLKVTNIRRAYIKRKKQS